jgi:methylated-DNA-[protein]-cysteine S-methyltransferase
MNIPLDAIHADCTAVARIATPLGPMLLARTADGLAGAWFDGQKHHPGAFDAPVRDDDALLACTAEQLHAYFDGDDVERALPFDLRGTTFQRRVWSALCEIPRGATRSYAQIAASIGAPQAVRAVGAAVGRNPLSILVPCHRVLGSDGALTGYAGGVERKRRLLALEAGAAVLA